MPRLSAVGISGLQAGEDVKKLLIPAVMLLLAVNVVNAGTANNISVAAMATVTNNSSNVKPFFIGCS